jgi:Na+-translocating ferredoxin:NAD+ oxidoreductase subunit B
VESESKMEKEAVYHQLHKEIDERMPLGFPEHKDGLEIKILKSLFSPEEANIAVHLSALPETLEKIHKRLTKNNIKISKEELENLLDGLSAKGAIMGGGLLYDRKKNLKRYSLANWAIGMFELQVNRMNKEFAKIADKYLLDTYYKEFHRKDRPTQMRTIPIEKSLSPDYTVGTYDNVKDIIKDTVDKIALVNCVCRQEHDLLEEPCQVSDVRTCCISFNTFADTSIENGNGEEVSKDELYKLLAKYQEEGFILQPENSQNPNYMCVCCRDCCGVLNMARKFPKPAEYYSSNFYAQVNSDLCSGCENCLSRCPMGAIDMIESIANVNLDRCIGCGNCTYNCSTGAMELHKKEKEIPPPKDFNALYQKIMMKKRGFFGSLKMIGKMILGKKV